jgi:hypothetical protein
MKKNEIHEKKVPFDSSFVFIHTTTTSICWRTFRPRNALSPRILLGVKGDEHRVKSFLFYIYFLSCKGELTQQFIGQCQPSQKFLLLEHLRPHDPEATIFVNVLGEPLFCDYFPNVVVDIIQDFCLKIDVFCT